MVTSPHSKFGASDEERCLGVESPSVCWSVVIAVDALEFKVFDLVFIES